MTDIIKHYRLERLRILLSKQLQNIVCEAQLWFEYKPLFVVFGFCVVQAIIYQLLFLSGTGEVIYQFNLTQYFFWLGTMIGILLVYNAFFPARRKKYILAIFLWTMIYFGVAAFPGEKSLIPYIHPYGLDLLFSEIDKTIHFGSHPYEILRVTSWPSTLLKFIDEAYMFWFMLMYAWLISIIIRNDARDRQKKIIAFLLCWHVIGIYCATLFSSVGPIFWNDYYTTPSPYQPLLNYLVTQNETLDLHVFFFYDLLREFQTNDTLVDLNAPSAMPSMHIGIAFLMFISTSSARKWTKIGLLLFLILMAIGSVALAWHYAIDGYVAIILTYLVWKGTSKVVDLFYQNQPKPENA